MNTIEKLHDQALTEARKYIKTRNLSIIYEAAYGRGYIAGAKYVMDHQWISVKDELPKPPKGEDILVIARSDDLIYIASYADDGWIVDFEGKSIKCNFIKYWMPIPELTKE